MDERLVEDTRNMASNGLDAEAWVQCWLRLTMRFQAEVGIPFESRKSRHDWCMQMSVYDVGWSWEGQFIRSAMIGAEITRDFQIRYESLLDEFDHHKPSYAHRLAFNQLMDEHWDELKKEALFWFEGPLSDDRMWR